MAYARKKLPSFFGEAELKYRGFQGAVEYEILGDPAGLRYGPGRLRGSFTAAPSIAEQAFREGEGVILLESGAAFRIVMLGHTAGSATGYFEMRV